jgi:hypothetical protein
VNLARYTSAVLILASPFARDVWAADLPTLCVHLQNEAAVPAQILGAAQAHMRRIYKNAGFEIVWGDDDGGCIVVRVEPRAMVPTSSAAVMGLALRLGRVKTAYIFSLRVADFAQKHQLPMSTLLGHVMAHEIGHLLLPANSHSSKGLMRGDWDGPQIRNARIGKLSFTETETRLMTRRLADHKSLSQLAHQP